MSYQKCPVCDGTGCRPVDFYPNVLKHEIKKGSRKVAAFVDCRACRGKGIIGVPDLPVLPSYPLPPAPFTPHPPQFIQPWIPWNPSKTGDPLPEQPQTISGQAGYFPRPDEIARMMAQTAIHVENHPPFVGAMQ